jgi:hypothetical protein
MNKPEQRSWFQRHWIWLVPVGCAGSVFVVFAVVALVVFAAFADFKSSWPYTEAIKLVRENPDVIYELGEPVRAGWLVGGSIRFFGSSGEAELAIPVRGPQNSGTIHVIAKKRAGQWQFESVEVEIRGSPTRIDILAGYEMRRTWNQLEAPVGIPNARPNEGGCS